MKGKMVIVLVLAALGMYLCYRWGYDDGYTKGHMHGYDLAMVDAKAMFPSKVEHKYRFIKNGDTLWRVDDATGEACDYWNGVCP
jgi:hypothetical protein